ncbi:MAG: heme-binding protein [Comamonadaceae bacterium]|nr:MAG: heme-binding protein [Comamonadaceae bacterium]
MQNWEVVSRPTISSAAAMQLVQRCIAAAEASNTSISVSICDPAGGLIAFHRMDDAALVSGELSEKKAYTAVLLGLETGKLYDFIKDKPALAISLPHTTNFVVIEGGSPIASAGHVIGGVGVSGGTPDQDAACVSTALQGFGPSEMK